MGNAIDINNLRKAIDENNKHIIDKINQQPSSGINISNHEGNALQNLEDGLYLEDIAQKLQELIGLSKQSEGKGGDGNGITLIQTNDIQPQLQKLPYAFYNGSAVSFNGHIHILGGTGDYTGHYSYDEYKNKWISHNSLPISFSRGCAVVCGGRLYILGGSAANNTTARKVAYVWGINDNGAGSDEWSEIASMPASRIDFGAYAVNDKIYVAGGRSGNTYYKTSYCYDPDTNTWSTLSDMPATRAMGTLLSNSSGTYLYYIGQHTGTTLTMYEYDIGNNIWGDMSSINENNDITEVFNYTYTGQSVVKLDDKAYLFTETGMFCSNIDSTVQQTKGWNKIHNNVNLPQKFSTKLAHNGKIYLLGSNLAAYNTLFAEYNDGGFFGKTSMNSPISTNDVCACMHENIIHYFYYHNNINDSDVSAHLAYDPKMNVWNYIGDIPAKTSLLRAISFNHALHLIGGANHRIWTEKDGWNEYPINFYLYSPKNSLFIFNSHLCAMSSEKVLVYDEISNEWNPLQIKVNGNTTEVSYSYYAYYGYVYYNNEMHRFSGDKNNSHGIVYLADIDGNSSKTLELSPLPVTSESLETPYATVINNKIYIFTNKSIVEYGRHGRIGDEDFAEASFKSVYTFGESFLGATFVTDETTNTVYINTGFRFYKLCFS